MAGWTHRSATPATDSPKLLEFFIRQRRQAEVKHFPYLPDRSRAAMHRSGQIGPTYVSQQELETRISSKP